MVQFATVIPGEEGDPNTDVLRDFARAVTDMARSDEQSYRENISELIGLIDIDTEDGAE